MSGFDCGQCGGQCDMCARSERRHHALYGPGGNTLAPKEDHKLAAFGLGYRMRWPLIFLTLIILIGVFLT